MASISSSTLDFLRLSETSAIKERRTPSRNIRQRISRQWIEACSEVLVDLRSTRWSYLGLWALFICWTIVTFSSWIFLIIYSISSTSFEDVSTACRSDGSFNPFLYEYTPWTTSGFFEINAGFGNYSFTEAKIIDIFWDIIIGRVGQAFMAFLSWRAFADYVTTSMNTAPVTYSAFSIIYLQDEPSTVSMFRLIRVFLSGRGFNSRVVMLFMIGSMLFLLLWPTFASAMAGYTTINKAFVQDFNNNFVPFSEFRPIAYMIHDGWRVDLGGDYAVPLFNPGASAGVDSTMYRRDTYVYDTCSLQDQSSAESRCSLQFAVSAYVSSFGFFGLQNTTSTWMNITIPSPVLNITAFYLSPKSSFFGSNWTDPRVGELKQPFNDPSRMAFTYSNTTYNLTYVEENGTCQPVRDRYKWGFSFIQVFLVITLHTIWIAGTLWLKARFQLPLRGGAEIPKFWRSLLILAGAMDKELNENEICPCDLTDRQLGSEIDNRLKGGSVSFYMPLERRCDSPRHSFSEWFKKEKWWCLALLTSAAFVYPVHRLFFLAAFFAIVACGVAFAIGIGKTSRSRILMIMCWFMVGTIVASGLSSLYIVEKH
ncbi:hypothetical protein F4818DRAFT_222256 [Hypoxylon cercidicola]|nr:hypothetical protein F4818DRAFT_222256 [Hypoxylon cercidicola]